MTDDFRSLDSVPETLDTALETVLSQFETKPQLREIGIITEVAEGIASVEGLPGVQSEELIALPNEGMALALNLDHEEVGIVLLDADSTLAAGQRVRRTGRVLDVPVGESLLGRVLDPLGRALDGRGPITSEARRPVDRPAARIMDRAPVATPLHTGIKVIDAMIPIGRGQRELIVGDRQTGKTSIAVDAILNQNRRDVICVYCAIGQRGSALTGVMDELRSHGSMEHTIVVATTGEDPAGLQYVAPYAATTMAEYFMEDGRDALVVYDDLTRHARAYRELSLLLRRPPGREAYPGDIFYIHSRLLERATHLNDARGGGSLTALPIVETQAQNLAAYIPTNLISITDGQVYLSPDLFQQGVLPAVDVGRSVSRVGGKAQYRAFRTITGDLKLSYSQFEELERFTRYGARLEPETRRKLEHGRRIREVLKQSERATLSPAAQIAVLYAATRGLFDELETEKVGEKERRIVQAMNEEGSQLSETIERGRALSEEDLANLESLVRQALSGG